MRSIATFLVLLGVLSGTFFPMGNVPVAYADVTQVITRKANTGQPNFYPAHKDSLGIVEVIPYSTLAEIKIKIKLRGGTNQEPEPAVDTNNNGKFDSGDEFGDWNQILTNDLHRSNDEGIFIQIGTGFTQTTYTDNGTTYPSETLTGVDTLNYGLSIPKTNTSINPSERPNFFLSSLVGGKAVNIGYYLWEVNAEKFFRDTDPVVTVVVNGLTPGTRYYVRALAFDDNFSTTQAIGAFSDSMSFETLPANQDPDPTTLGAGLIEEDQTTDSRVNLFGQLIECSILPPELGGCLLELFYDIVYTGSSLILLAAGKLFDVFVKLGIGSTMYERPTAEFVWAGWTIVRDIANIFFIFILLYSALALILGIHGFNVKKTIAKVILIAILINFSLFFTRVVVDVSNVFARVFYNAITIKGVPEEPLVTETGKTFTEKSLSRGIMNGLNVQKMIGQDAFTALEKSEGGISTGRMFFILLLGTALNLYAAFIFFMCGVFFAGRIGTIWFSMVFVPLALVSGIVPSLDKGLKQLGWSGWMSTFMKACFNAPIFLFFMYLIIKLIDTVDIGQFVSSDNTKDLLPFLVAVSLPFMIIIGLLRESKKIAEEMAGEFGSAFAGAFSAVIGAGAMIATGGAAAIGSRVIGGAASKTLQNQDLKDAASGDKKKLQALQAKGLYKDFDFNKKEDIAKVQKSAGGKLKRADYLSKASFDVRQTGIANQLSSATGINMNTGAGWIAPKAFGTDQTAGGFQGIVQRKAEKEEKFKKLLGSNTEAIHHKEENIKKDKTEMASAEKDLADVQVEVKLFKDKNPGKAVPPQLAEALENATKNVNAIKHGTDGKNVAIGPTKVTKTSSGGYATVGGGKTIQKEGISKQEQAVESMKTERQKAYVGYLKDQSESTKKGDSPVGRELIQTLREGFRQAKIGGGVGAGIGIFAGMPGIVTGALVGSVAGVINGGVLPALKTVLREGNDFIGESISKGMSSGFNFNGKGSWSGKYKGEKGQVVEAVSHKEFHTQNFKATYKAPNSKFFDLFKSGGGGGGGNADHGGGDDHGGGGHH
jgi:hypothetical protein